VASRASALANILRYAGSAGPIEFRARILAEGGTEITITDQGPGVPADALTKIFEPFYRPEAARQRSTGGTGLGLAIVKRCVEACGGTVTAKNGATSGLEVRVHLPERRPA